MTTDLRALSLLVHACLLLGCGGSNDARRGDRVDTSKYPEEIQDAYKVFAFRCSRCHTLARPLNARIHDPEHWIRYVRRMRRQPSSGIDAQNGEVILKFLLYYHHARPDEPSAPSEPSEPNQKEPPP